MGQTRKIPSQHFDPDLRPSLIFNIHPVYSTSLQRFSDASNH
jgi:hypothetical protein